MDLAGEVRRMFRAREPFRIGIVDRVSEQHLGLGQIRRNQRREREQQMLDLLHRLLGDETHAARRDHDRIDDLRDFRVLRQSVGNHLDRRRIGQHAGLHRADVVNAQHGVQLGRDKVRRHGVDGRDPKRILRRQRCENCAPVTTIVVERPQIGLHAGIPAGIRPCDCQTALPTRMPKRENVVRNLLHGSYYSKAACHPSSPTCRSWCGGRNRV